MTNEIDSIDSALTAVNEAINLIGEAGDYIYEDYEDESLELEAIYKSLETIYNRIIRQEDDKRAREEWDGWDD